MNLMVGKVALFFQQERKKIVFLFPIVMSLCFILLKLRFKYIYSAIIQEDSVIEYLQTVFYFVAAWIALLIAKGFRGNRTPFLVPLYILFSLALLFVSLEEISWGQRIFRFQGPSIIVEHNSQQEFTVHNLNVLNPYLHNAYILVGFLGAFTDLLLPRRLKNKFQSIVRFVVPDRILVFYFLPTFIIYIYMQYVSGILVQWFGLQSWQVGSFIVWRDQEPAEFLLSLGFLLFVLITRSRQKLQIYMTRT